MMWGDVWSTLGWMGSCQQKACWRILLCSRHSGCSLEAASTTWMVVHCCWSTWTLWSSTHAQTEWCEGMPSNCSVRHFCLSVTCTPPLPQQCLHNEKWRIGLGEIQHAY